MNISYKLLGAVEISAYDDNIIALLNLCMYCGIPYTDFKNMPDGSIRLIFKLSDSKKVFSECRKRGIEINAVKKIGLPPFLYKYRRRYGLVLGMLIAVAITVLSQQYIWDIRITGNETMTSSEVGSLLEQYGLKVGTYIPKLNTDKLENKLLINSEKISWISVNITGNVAQVQIRENKSADKNEELNNKFANLVAEKSGIIQQVQIFRGNIRVKAGDYVNEGDLLVSGLYDSDRVGFRYTRASGIVMAKTVNEYVVEIPLEYEEKEYTGNVNFEKYLNFFGYSFNISKNCRNDMMFYDTISTVENCSFPDGTQTPIEIQTIQQHEYRYVTKQRTYEEAERLAYYKLSQLIADEGDVMVIRKIITPEAGDDFFRLHCIVVCIENIAKVSEFEVDLSQRPEDSLPEKVS